MDDTLSFKKDYNKYLKGTGMCWKKRQRLVLMEFHPFWFTTGFSFFNESFVPWTKLSTNYSLPITYCADGFVEVPSHNASVSINFSVSDKTPLHLFPSLGVNNYQNYGVFFTVFIELKTSFTMLLKNRH